MYFRAFREHQKSPLGPDPTYIVEQLVSQLLATADVSALKTALQEKCLAEMLVAELSFLGQLPSVHLPQVREYLIEQEPTGSAAQPPFAEMHGPASASRASSSQNFFI